MAGRLGEPVVGLVELAALVVPAQRLRRVPLDGDRCARRRGDVRRRLALLLALSGRCSVEVEWAARLLVLVLLGLFLGPAQLLVERFLLARLLVLGRSEQVGQPLLVLLLRRQQVVEAAPALGLVGPDRARLARAGVDLDHLAAAGAGEREQGGAHGGSRSSAQSPTATTGGVVRRSVRWPVSWRPAALTRRRPGHVRDPTNDPAGTSAGGRRLVLSSLRRAPSSGAVAAAADDADPVRAVVRQAQQGDLDAFRALVDQFSDRVMRVIVNVMHCDWATAEDLCQETFLRVHGGLAGFDGQRFTGWLATIATNVAISELRRRRAQKRGQRTLSLDAPIAGTDDLYLDPAGREQDPAQRAHHREFAARVREAVRELPEEFRVPVVLRDMDGMSYEDIAATLGVPPGTVRSRIHRGRLLLQDLLKEFGA
ncbi:MAG: sigma-70 family RNA polymerase sigma factor [Planctomycetes bacterium]|nr:sigma-70 family RNA polymerase sigma factor [Planctomycetota bacterium]